MAVFTNQARLSYNGGEHTSNIVTGEMLEVLSLDKDAVTETYEANGTVAFVISLVNTGGTALDNLTLTEDLGGYALGSGETVYPLSYVEGSLHAFGNGGQKAAPTVTAGPPMVITGVSVPANGSTLLVFDTEVTPYAPPAAGSGITATVTAAGAGLTEPLTASDTVTVANGAALAIHKTMSPDTVSSGETLTYTFLIRNGGGEAADAAALVTVTDTFGPALAALTVTLDGAALNPGADYTYDETTGAFATVPGRITVPAASFAQDDDGVWSAVDGTATLIVSGTV